MNDIDEIDDSDVDSPTAAAPVVEHDRNGNGNGKLNGNGNGDHGRDDAIGEPEYFLTSLLASDPVPYLFDGEGNLVDAEGNPLSESGDDAGLPPGIRRLQAEALAPAPSEPSES